MVQVKDYDYYGAYDTQKNENYKYNQLLGEEYTFDFPPHHNVVSCAIVVCFSLVCESEGNDSMLFLLH